MGKLGKCLLESLIIKNKKKGRGLSGYEFVKDGTTGAWKGKIEVEIG